MTGLRSFWTHARCIAALLVLSLTIGPALGGTEDGSFCPTCPDWTNLDGWMAQKEEYELENSPLVKAQSTSGNSSAGNGDASNGDKTAAVVGVQALKGYAVPEIFAVPGSFSGKVLLDARSPDEYSKGHLPGARNIYWKGIQTSERLDPALAEEALGRAGINSSDQILIYGGSDSGAAYLFWALSYLGQKNLSKLNGGIDAAYGTALETSVPSVMQSNYTAKVIPWLMVDESELGFWMSRDDIQILDARDFTDYGMSRLTTSALQIPLDKLYEDDVLVTDPEELEGIFKARSLNKNSTQMVYGTPQAYALFYTLRLMGYNATVIDGDWWSKTEWVVNNVR